MNKPIIIAVWIALQVLEASATCTNELSCFKNTLFNFQYPREGIYPMERITPELDNDYNVLGYGDFDNNLWTDMIVSLPENNTLAILIWNKQSSQFEQKSTIVPSDCEVSSVFLYDADLDGFLDVTVWGEALNQNCLIPFLQKPNLQFEPLVSRFMQKTSQPFVLAFGGNNGREKTNALCIFENGTRTLLKLDTTVINSYIVVGWERIFESDRSFVNIPFAAPHWNSYVDLTGDCRADVVIVDDAYNIQIWINYGLTFEYSYSLSSDSSLTSLFFADMDYSGTPDLVMSTAKKVTIKPNMRHIQQSSDFCCENCFSVDFSEQQFYVEIEKNFEIRGSPPHISDVDINGYPDMLLILHNSTHQTVRLYLNRDGTKFETDSNYDLGLMTEEVIISASFIDFLENGILDFLVVLEEDGAVTSRSYINNYLQQNSFYIKGYAASGRDEKQGCQFLGATFFWVNSLGESVRLTLQSQITQTAYNSLQLPFAFSGLGRSNNYVESFTMGAFGQKRGWSPIIPNSQLAVYAPGESTQDWSIRVFVLPTDSLIYVMIVSVIILTVLGGILVGLKCRDYNKKKEEPLMQFIH